VDAQGIVSLATQGTVDWGSYSTIGMVEHGTIDMAALGTTCMAVQGIMDLVADSTTYFFYNWSSRIKRNLVLVLFSVLFICTLFFFRESHSLPKSLVVPTLFTTITLGILRTKLPEKGDNVNRIVDQPQDLQYRISTCTIEPTLVLQDQHLHYRTSICTTRPALAL
jgi:hypothetical protein